MIRAIFEGVGYSVLDIADRLGRDGRRRSRRVSASGGLARLDPVNQIKADMLGVPVRLDRRSSRRRRSGQRSSPVSTIGDWASMEEATTACVRSSSVFEPDPARTRMYRDFFAIYRGLYDQLAGPFVAREGLIAQHARGAPDVAVPEREPVIAWPDAVPGIDDLT